MNLSCLVINAGEATLYLAAKGSSSVPPFDDGVVWQDVKRFVCRPKVDSTNKILATHFQLYTRTVLLAFSNDGDFFYFSISLSSTEPSWAVERQKLSFECNGAIELQLLQYLDVGICKWTKGT